MGSWRGRPAWLWFTCLVTGAYLVVELAFNSRLLDVVGGGASAAEVDRIELWGRLISGFALALAFWPVWLKRSRYIPAYAGEISIGETFVRLVALTGVCMVAMYLLQEALVRHYVDRTSTQERRTARQLVLLQLGLVEGVAVVEGMDLSPDRLTSPDSKAFLAMFPLMGSSLGDSVSSRFPALARHEVARKVVASRMGDPQLHFDGYKQVLGRLNEFFGQYRKPSDLYQRALSRVDAEQDRAWGDYVNAMRRRGMNPYRVKRWYHSDVRYEVQKRGIPVGNGWVPGDRAGFNKAVAEVHHQRAGSAYYEGLRERAPEFAGLPPGLDAAGFMASPKVQGIVLRSLGYGCLSGFRSPIASAGDFMAHLFNAEVRCQAERMTRTMEQGDAGSSEEGRNAMKALIVPPLALGFSLAGALAHVFKLMLYASELVRGRMLYPFLLRWSLTLGLALLAMSFCATGLHSPVTRSGLYLYLQERTSPPMALLIRGTIHGQQYGYPLFEAMRRDVLFGFDFGYKPGVGPAMRRRHGEDETR